MGHLMNRFDGGCAPPNPAPLAAEAFGGNFAVLPAASRKEEGKLFYKKLE